MRGDVVRNYYGRDTKSRHEENEDSRVLLTSKQELIMRLRRRMGLV
jgi:hypothetical protein